MAMVARVSFMGDGAGWVDAPGSAAKQVDIFIYKQ